MISFKPMYELMVIAKTDSSDQVFSKVEKFLKDIDAVSVKAEKLGKKTLAYPIAKQTEGDFFLYNFDAESQTLKGLADKIRLEQEAILRHLLIKVEKPRKESKRQRVKEAESKVEEEVVKSKPTVTVTTRAKVSELTKVSNGSKTKNVKNDVDSKKAKKAVKSTKEGKS